MRKRNSDTEKWEDTFDVQYAYATSFNNDIRRVAWQLYKEWPITIQKKFRAYLLNELKNARIDVVVDVPVEELKSSSVLGESHRVVGSISFYVFNTRYTVYFNFSIVNTITTPYEGSRITIRAESPKQVVRDTVRLFKSNQALGNKDHSEVNSLLFELLQIAFEDYSFKPND